MTGIWQLRKKAAVLAWLRPALILILVLSASLCIGWGDSWEGIRKAAGTVQGIDARFTQEKHLPILARPLVSTGRLVYQRPDRLRWEYQSPLKSVLLMDDGQARRFALVGGRMVEDESVQLAAMQFVMPEISGWLSGNFADNPMFEASLDGTRRILLTPKDEGMAQFIQRIELRLSTRPGIIDEVRIYEGDDAYTRMVFSHTRVNPRLDDRLFTEAP